MPRNSRHLTASPPRLQRASLLLGLLLLAGCAGRDPTDTPLAWWHQLEGGEIARDRPPPPGVDAPYPHVGTTPAKAPPVASPQLRDSVTQDLLAQRTLSARLDASDPLPPPAPAVKPAAAAHDSAPAARPAAAAAPQDQSSATFDAAEAPPSAAAPARHADRKAADEGGTGSSDQASPSRLAMPAMPGAPATPPGTTALSGPLPDLPPAPPAMAGVSGIPVAPTVHSARPDYVLRQPSGTRIAFAPGTDALASGQAGAVHAAAASRHGGMLTVQGYGDAASNDPEAQARALVLALLRARAVARQLQDDGVAPASLRLAAFPFGGGAIISPE